MSKWSGNCTVLQAFSLARHEVVWFCLFALLTKPFWGEKLSNLSSLYQYCQISVSPRLVAARGIPVGQQACSGEFHTGVSCEGCWTSCRVPLEYAFCSGKLLQALTNATSRFHQHLQGGEIRWLCLHSASNWMSCCILRQIRPAFKNSNTGLEQL